jgi:hypothetical protein
MLPPAIIVIRRVEQGKRRLGLWLPVFILWLPALAIALLLSPVFVLLALLYPFAEPVRRFFRGLRAAALICCSLRGLAVDIEKPDKEIAIKVI